MEKVVFMTAFQALMKQKGSKVSKKALQQFFCTVSELCPWFPKEGTVSLDAWQKVGQEIKNQIKIHGPTACPPSTMQVWEDIREVLDPQHSFKLISIASQEPPDRPEVHDLPKVTEDIEDLMADLPLPSAELIEQTSNSRPPPSHSICNNKKCEPHAAPPRVPPTPPLIKVGGYEIEEDDVYLDDDKEVIFSSSAPARLRSFSQQDIHGKIPTSRKLRPVLGTTSSGTQTFTVNHTETQTYGSVPAKPNSQIGYSIMQHENGQRRYADLNFKILKEIKTATAQYGPTAPYTLYLLDSVGQVALCPDDWRVIAKACLSGGDYLLWKTEFYERANEMAVYNHRTNIPVSYEMLIGMEAYAEVSTQIDYPEIAYNQIGQCALTAWKRLPSSGTRTVELSKIRQGPDEHYQDFVARLLKEVGRIVDDGEARTIIVKHLAFENANSFCQVAIRPRKNKGTLEDYIRLCAEIGSSYIQGITLAAALRGISPQEMQKRMMQKGNNKKQTCFQCGHVGHFKAQCPQLMDRQVKNGKISKKPPLLCPKCQRGYHWANECRSQKDKFGNIIQGNWRRGSLQPQQTIAAMIPQMSALGPVPRTSQASTSYSAVPPPVQD